MPRTPGHQPEENVAKSEGEVESSASDSHEAPAAATADSTTTAPDTAAKAPAAKAPAAAPELEAEPPVKETEALSEAQEAPENAPEIAEVAKKDSLQEAVDKAQASKEGHIGSLDGGDKEGAGRSTLFV